MPFNLVATIAFKLLQALEARAMVSSMIRRSFAWVFGTLLAVGCPSRFDPRAQPNVRSPDQGADRAFSDARKQFEAGQYDAARLSFHQFVEQFPQDPLKPFAQIFIGRAAYEKGNYALARSALEGPAAGNPAEAATSQARFYLALALARMGQCAQSQQRLEGIAERVAPGDDALEMHAALAACAERSGDIAQALYEWGAYWEIARD